MSLNLQTLPHPNVRTAIADYSRDCLGCLTRCAREFEGIVPFQFGDAWQSSITLRPKHGIQVVFKKI